MTIYQHYKQNQALANLALTLTNFRFDVGNAASFRVSSFTWGIVSYAEESLFLSLGSGEHVEETHRVMTTDLMAAYTHFAVIICTKLAAE